jgi:hypothetical protein
LRRNCLLKHVTEGKIEERIEVKGRQGRIRKKLEDKLKKKTGCWKFKEEALDHICGESALQADMALSTDRLEC